jgi:hypothetical protein
MQYLTIPAPIPRATIDSIVGCSAQCSPSAIFAEVQERPAASAADMERGLHVIKDFLDAVVVEGEFFGIQPKGADDAFNHNRSLFLAVQTVHHKFMDFFGTVQDGVTGFIEHSDLLQAFYGIEV